MAIVAHGNIWYVKFKHLGQQVQLSTGIRKRGRSGNRRAAEVEAERLKVEYRKAHPSPAKGCRLSQLEAADIRRSIAAGADQRTRRRTLTGIWRPIIEYFGEDTNPDGLTYDDLEEYVAWRRAQTFRGDPVRGQTIRRELQALKTWARNRSPSWLDHSRSRPLAKAQERSEAQGTAGQAAPTRDSRCSHEALA